MAESSTDTILLPLLEAEKKKRESYLSELISTHAEPVIRKIINYRLSISVGRTNTKESWDAEDVCGNALIHLLSQLSKFSENPQEHPIRDFRGYAAGVAHHACNQYFRDKFPKRTQLKNKLRYLFNHTPDFSLWTEHEQLVCGLNRWKNQSPPTHSQELASRVGNLRGRLPEDPDPFKLLILLKNVFQMLGHPLFLHDLVTLMVDLLGIQEQRQVEESKDRSENILEQIKDQRGDTFAEIEHRLYLKRLWLEMVALPLRQKTALLLSIRDHHGNSVLYLFPLTQVTSIHGIAESLGISSEDFASLWNKLPLEDNDIAMRLGVARQQVINLRRSARERLARRMKQV